MCSHVLGEDRPETSYTRVMGHMDVVSIISDYFNIYFPILLILLTLATYFSLGIFNIKIIMFFWAQEKGLPSHKKLKKTLFKTFFIQHVVFMI